MGRHWTSLRAYWTSGPGSRREHLPNLTPPHAAQMIANVPPHGTPIPEALLRQVPRPPGRCDEWRYDLSVRCSLVDGHAGMHVGWFAFIRRSVRVAWAGHRAHLLGLHRDLSTLDPKRLP